MHSLSMGEFSFPPPHALLITMCSYRKKIEINLLIQILSCNQQEVLLSIPSAENTFPLPLLLKHC